MPQKLDGTFHSYQPIRKLGQGAFGEVGEQWTGKVTFCWLWLLHLTGAAPCVRLQDKLIRHATWMFKCKSIDVALMH